MHQRIIHFLLIKRIKIKFTKNRDFIELYFCLMARFVSVSAIILLIVIKSSYTFSDHFSTTEGKKLAGRFESCFQQEECVPNLKCISFNCTCDFGYGYDETKSLCVPFGEFTCNKNIDCQDADENRMCSNYNKKCNCRSGYESVNNICVLYSYNLLSPTLFDFLLSFLALLLFYAIVYIFVVCKRRIRSQFSNIHSVGQNPPDIELQNRSFRENQNPNNVHNETSINSGVYFMPCDLVAPGTPPPKYSEEAEMPPRYETIFRN